jgi:hypothetical protein
MVFWYVLCPFVNLLAILYISAILVHCAKKNLATLLEKPEF